MNTGYGFASRAGDESGQESRSAAWVRRAKPDPDLIYSEVLPIHTNDLISPWSLWVGHSDERFFGGAEARWICTSEYVAYGVIALLTLSPLGLWALIQRNLGMARAASTLLERRVAERTAEIRHMATHDALTGLPNRTLLREKMEAELARVRRGETLAILASISIASRRSMTHWAIRSVTSSSNPSRRDCAAACATPI